MADNSKHGIAYSGDTIYRVTRKHPYRGQQVKLCSKRSVTGQIAAFKAAVEWAATFGRRVPDTAIVKIEQAEIGPFTDVSSEFLGGE